jgi:uncharacterized protein YbaR (Trm112 family)
MKLKMMEIICCPLCKGELKLLVDNSSESIDYGKMVCNQCSNVYQIIDGIPRLYVDIDDIKVSNTADEFSEFVITDSNLERLIMDNKIIIGSNFYTNKIITWLLIGFGWSSLVLSLLILIIGYFAIYDVSKYILLPIKTG